MSVQFAQSALYNNKVMLHQKCEKSTVFYQMRQHEIAKSTHKSQVYNFDL